MKLMDFVNKEYFVSDDKFNKCVKVLEKMKNDNLKETNHFCYNFHCDDCVFSSFCFKSGNFFKLDEIVIDDKKFNAKEFYDYFIPSLILEYKNYKATKSDIKSTSVEGDKIQGAVPNTHYKQKIEPLEYIIANNFDFVRGNIIKYASRAGRKKGEEMNDIKKIIDYALILAIQEGINIDFDELKKLIDYRKEWKK